jgi:hypothetical protein
MGSTTERPDGLMRAKDLAVGKVHTMVDFRVVEPYLPNSWAFGRHCQRQ